MYINEYTQLNCNELACKHPTVERSFVPTRMYVVRDDKIHGLKGTVVKPIKLYIIGCIEREPNKRRVFIGTFSTEWLSINYLIISDEIKKKTICKYQLIVNDAKTTNNEK